MFINIYYINNNNGKIISKNIYDKLNKKHKNNYREIEKDLTELYAYYLQDENTRFLINCNDSQDVVTLEQFLELPVFKQEFYRIANDEENQIIKNKISLTPFLDLALKYRNRLYGKNTPINKNFKNFLDWQLNIASSIPFLLQEN